MIFSKKIMMNKEISPIALFAFLAVAAIAVGVLGGYKYGAEAGLLKGQTKGYGDGYAAAEANIAKLQKETTDKVAQDAAAAANPFLVGNVLEGVNSDPFLKVKKTLNPF